jgi:hypothetical protein
MANNYNPYDSRRRAGARLQLIRGQEECFSEQQTEEIPASAAKSYLLNTNEGTIRAVMLSARNRTEHIHELIESSKVDVVRVGTSHRVYANNNGLTDGLASVTDLKGHPSPLAGNLLIVGSDATGRTSSVSASIDDVASWFTIVRPVFLPVFETLRGSQTVSVRVIRLDVRIERSTPSIVE